MTRAANLAEAAGSGFAFRNRIINGAMQFWQRGTGPTLVHAGSVFVADRWGTNQYQQGRHQRAAVTSPPTGLNAKYALQVGSSTTTEVSTGTRMVASQMVESVNCQDLAGQKVTVSCWIKFSSATFNSVTNAGPSSAFGNFGLSIWFITSTTDAPSGSTSADSAASTYLYNGSLPTTWTQITLTATVPAGTNNLSVRCGFDYLGSTATADQNFYHITQVQLEAGSTATPFEFRQYGTELALCQRYYEQSPNLTTYINAATRIAFATNYLLGTQWIVPKRATPSVVLYSRIGTANKVSNISNGADVGSTVTPNNTSTVGFHIAVDTGALFTVGAGYEYNYIANAEL